MIIGSDAMAEVVEEKSNKLHRYLAVVLLFLVCIGFVLYLCELYKVDKEEKRKIPVIRDALGEIYPDDLDYYVVDNPTSVIYMCTANNDVCRTFEKGFKKLLQKKDYNGEIIYLNLTDIDLDEFTNAFNQKYPYKGGITTNYPAFILFEDGKVVSILEGTVEKPLTVSKVKNYLELNEIGE